MTPQGRLKLKRTFIFARLALFFALRRARWVGVSKARKRRTSSRIPSVSSLALSRLSARSIGSPFRTVTSGIINSPTFLRKWVDNLPRLKPFCQINRQHPFEPFNPAGGLYSFEIIGRWPCRSSRMTFSARLSARWALTTNRAWMTPGIQPKSVRKKFRNAWSGLPQRRTARGGRTIARR